MKKLFLGSMLFILALFISSGAGALTINDSTSGLTTYYGGAIKPTAGSYDDVIGVFPVDSLTATQTATTTTVVLSGPYFGTNHAKEISQYGHIGDLYISSTGWKVNNPADHARYDTFDSNEGWDYVITYSNPFAYVYSLNNFGGITMTGNELNHWIGYRANQAYEGGYSGSSLYTGTSSLDSVLQTLTFTFPNLGPVDLMGYHWTVACGNDVVEGGGTPIPEPATMLLLGSGLLGIAGLRRKLKK